MTQTPPWTDVLKLRPEVLGSGGSPGELQMSLYKAVFQTVEVPYRDVEYYADITEPTPNIVGFLGRVARRLSGLGDGAALFHLDQGMGGGKSHALVGLFHMAAHTAEFFSSEFGAQIRAEAEQYGRLDLGETRCVVLTADYFTPGVASEAFGPATTLFERFLWSLFEGDNELYGQYRDMGPNKATLLEALRATDRPVLILLDELMDYALALSDEAVVASMVVEQGFLNALMDACDDIPRVAFVVVMIRSDLDPEGYPPIAGDFREYVTRRLHRNGETVAVTESSDFASIIRRRIFERPTIGFPVDAIAEDVEAAVGVDPAWQDHVLAKLGPGRGTESLRARITASYPFHPDLMDLVQDEWGQVQGFQRVRSTVAIFALTAMHWHREASEGYWVPSMIGLGDIPLTAVLERILSSGLLLNNDRAVQGYRAVATTDITSSDGSSGKAVTLDARRSEAEITSVACPSPVVRMATALFAFSLVSRRQGRRGATRPELLATFLAPDGGVVPRYSAVEEIFLALTGEDGLGAIEVIRSPGSTERYWLTIKQTLRMFFNAARASIGVDEKRALLWETARTLARKGSFDQVRFLQSGPDDADLGSAAAGMDSLDTRLIVADPRRWTLSNGGDEPTRSEVESFLGVGSAPLVVDHASSAVVAIAHNYRHRQAVTAGGEVLAWRIVHAQVVEDDERSDAHRELRSAERKLEEATHRAYLHYAYLIRRNGELEVRHGQFESDAVSSLDGGQVWSALVNEGRAVGEYTDSDSGMAGRRVLSELYVATLLEDFARNLTLKEVTASFYQNPDFPLVPGAQEIRTVLFDLTRPAGHAGEGTGGWDLLDGAGNRLDPQSPDEIAIQSIQQTIQRHTESDDRSDGQHGVQTPEDGTSDDPGDDSDEHESYAWYRIAVRNRSITDPDRRELTRKALLWLVAVLDDPTRGHQLVSLKFDLLAGKDQDFGGDFERRRDSLGLDTVEIEDHVD